MPSPLTFTVGPGLITDFFGRLFFCLKLSKIGVFLKDERESQNSKFENDMNCELSVSQLSTKQLLLYLFFDNF